MLKNLQKIYLIYYNLLIAQDLWLAHYKILAKIFLKEFIELSVNSDMVIKNVKHLYLYLNISISKHLYSIKSSLKFVYSRKYS